MVGHGAGTQIGSVGGPQQYAGNVDALGKWGHASIHPSCPQAPESLHDEVRPRRNR